MNAFELVIGEILEAEGYWIRHSFKVPLTKEEKKKTGKGSRPRPELDILAFNFQKNELLVVECKSYLYSYGVSIDDFRTESSNFKLFNDSVLRKVVVRRLKVTLKKQGYIHASTKVKFAVAAGKVRNGHGQKLQELFNSRKWILFPPAWIRERLEDIPAKGYEDRVSAMVAKILLRE